MSETGQGLATVTIFMATKCHTYKNKEMDLCLLELTLLYYAHIHLRLLKALQLAYVYQTLYGDETSINWLLSLSYKGFRSSWLQPYVTNLSITPPPYIRYTVQPEILTENLSLRFVVFLGNPHTFFPKILNL